MNINLISDDNNEKEILEGHQNVLLNDIDTIPPNICTSIIINNTLNYLTHEQLISLLGKMRHGGTINIISPDAMEMARALYWGEINTQKLSSLIANNKTQHSLIEIKTFFEQSGYVVNTANLNGLSFNIKVQRP